LHDICGCFRVSITLKCLLGNCLLDRVEPRFVRKCTIRNLDITLNYPIDEEQMRGDECEMIVKPYKPIVLQKVRKKLQYP